MKIIKKNLYIPAFFTAFTLLFSVLMIDLRASVSDTSEEIRASISIFNLKPRPEKKRKISKNAKQSAPLNEPISEPASTDSNYMDLAFNINIQPPQIIGNLNKIYPEEARNEKAEAMVFVELFISKEGEVEKVTVLEVILNKEFPDDKKSAIVQKFSRAAKEIFQTARFTRPYVENENIPIRMEQTLEFKLNL
ncbi:MAG: energy transducer TonB [Spirochaetia bacterium]|nr:energy transducer TonB [Spirochaetia bacterium]